MKYLLVEGRADKLQVQPLLQANEVTIICTNGTISEHALEQILEPIEQHEIFTLFDADYTGNRLRDMMQRLLPEAENLHTDAYYIEVERTPRLILVAILQNAGFTTTSQFYR